MNIEEKYLEKIWARINNGDDDRLMLSWDEQFDITDILKEYHAEQLLQANVSCSSDGCYECGSNNLRPKEYNCLDCGHDGYCY